MNFSEFIEKAKPILKDVKTLKEEAGSEGLSYKVKFNGTLPEEGLKIKEKVDDAAIIEFDYPHDFGFALQTLKDLGVEVVSLELLF